MRGFGALDICSGRSMRLTWAQRFGAQQKIIANEDSNDQKPRWGVLRPSTFAAADPCDWPEHSDTSCEGRGMRRFWVTSISAERRWSRLGREQVSAGTWHHSASVADDDDTAERDPLWQPDAAMCSTYQTVHIVHTHTCQQFRHSSSFRSTPAIQGQLSLPCLRGR